MNTNNNNIISPLNKDIWILIIVQSIAEDQLDIIERKIDDQAQSNWLPENVDNQEDDEIKLDDNLIKELLEIKETKIDVVRSLRLSSKFLKECTDIILIESSQTFMNKESRFQRLVTLPRVTGLYNNESLSLYPRIARIDFSNSKQITIRDWEEIENIFKQRYQKHINIKTVCKVNNGQFLEFVDPDSFVITGEGFFFFFDSITMILVDPHGIMSDSEPSESLKKYFAKRLEVIKLICSIHRIQILFIAHEPLFESHDIFEFMTTSTENKLLKFSEVPVINREIKKLDENGHFKNTILSLARSVGEIDTTESNFHVNFSISSNCININVEFHPEKNKFSGFLCNVKEYRISDSEDEKIKFLVY